MSAQANTDTELEAPSGAAACDAFSCPSFIQDDTLPYPFCPGCGHKKIAGLVDDGLRRLGLPADKVVVVTDIGCVGLTDKHFGTHAFHGLHGRSITYASGIKLANPDLKVVVIMGDGATGIGGAHLLSAARRNIGITLIVANNFNYGMTGGQHSVTTPPGSFTSTTLKGNIEQPLDILGTVRPSKPSFLARTSVWHDDAGDLVAKAIATEGFAVVDIWDICVAYFAGANELNGSNVDDRMRELEMPPGILYEGDRPEFSRAWRELYVPEEVADEEGMCLLPPEEGLVQVAESTLDRRWSILVAGAAGQKIRSLATLLGGGAIMSGLYSTQKDDYPITVRTGHSAAEIILSPEPIDFTGIEVPDVVLLISEEGVRHVGKKLKTYPPETRVYVDAGLAASIDTPAEVIVLPLAEAAKKVHRLAIGAVGVGAILEREGVYPAEAFSAAARKLQKAKVAQTNIDGLEIGRGLV